MDDCWLPGDLLDSGSVSDSNPGALIWRPRLEGSVWRWHLRVDWQDDNGGEPTKCLVSFRPGADVPAVIDFAPKALSRKGLLLKQPVLEVDMSSATGSGASNGNVGLIGLDPEGGLVLVALNPDSARQQASYIRTTDWMITPASQSADPSVFFSRWRLAADLGGGRRRTLIEWTSRPSGG